MTYPTVELRTHRPYAPARPVCVSWVWVGILAMLAAEGLLLGWLVVSAIEGIVAAQSLPVMW
jgi:hypothetical protein